VLGGPRLRISRPDTEGLHVPTVSDYEALGQSGGIDILLLRPGDDFVIDVGEVLDVLDLVAGVSQVAADDVEDHRPAGVTEVAQVVDRHPADIHSHFPRSDGNELLFPSFESVVDLQ